MKALFLGDSHIAHLSKYHIPWLEQELAATIETAAFGGAWSGDLRRQIGNRDLGSFDVVLLSIGTNDTHPMSNSSHETLRDNVVRVVDASKRVVLLVSPGVNRPPPPYDTSELNRAIRSYTRVAADAVTRRGGVLVPTAWIVDELGDTAWQPDGLHFSTESYDLLMPSLAHALRDEQTGK